MEHETPVVFNDTYKDQSHWQVYHGSKLVGYMLGRWESNYEAEDNVTWRLFSCEIEDAHAHEPYDKDQGEIMRGNLSFVTGYAQAYFEAKFGRSPLDPQPPCSDCNGKGTWQAWSDGGQFMMNIRCLTCEGTGRELPQPTIREPYGDELLLD